MTAGLSPGSRIVMAAAVTGTVAFAAYARTLLPGVDLGDTGGFQAAVLWPETSARRAYPLYYALAEPFVRWVDADNPARGLNLFSAVCAAVAVALLTAVTALVARTVRAGVVAGMLLAFSYTFWSQAVIAEVYALHLALVAASLLALFVHARRPTATRLAVFFLVFACSFGNHLATVLFLAPFAVFLIHAHPAPRDLLVPRVILLAFACAAVGALLYLSNLMFVWVHIDAPTSWADRFAAFWLDTTKADWRETMVAGVSPASAGDRLAMWIWDARQQFGVAGLALAAAGAARLWYMTRPWAVLVCFAYAVSTLFALTYNVGDTHVFFLPGHLFVALAAGAALAPCDLARRRAFVPDARTLRAVVSAAAVGYAVWRGWHTWPVADRHADRRAEQLVARTTAGLTDAAAVLLTRMDWQSENAVLYASRYQRRDLAWTRLADVLPHLPYFVRDNHSIGRDVVLDARAAADVAAAYGPLFTLVPESAMAAPPLAEIVRRIPARSPYVLASLTPHDEWLDRDDVASALSRLARTTIPSNDAFHYRVWAGLAGESAVYRRASDRPFAEDLTLQDDSFTVRMDAWLPFDTFRRGGFGHVLQGRRRVLVIERGISLVWLDAAGEAHVAYAAGLYAPRSRFRIPAGAPQPDVLVRDAILERAALPP